MELNQKQIEYILKSHGCKIHIDNKWYYVKKNRNDYVFPYSEIVAEKIARLLNINCAHYEFVKIDNGLYSRDYYFSESLSELGNARSMLDIEDEIFLTNHAYINYKDGPSKASLYEIWSELELIFGDCLDLMQDVTKIYLFDIMFLCSDRHPENLFIVDEQGQKKAYLIDNEFFWKKRPYLSSDYTNQFFTNNIKENYEELALKDLNSFLSTSSNAYIELFKDMLNKATPEAIKEVLLEVETLINDELIWKDEFLEEYQIYYEQMQNLLAERTQNGRK